MVWRTEPPPTYLSVATLLFLLTLSERLFVGSWLAYLSLGLALLPKKWATGCVFLIDCLKNRHLPWTLSQSPFD